MKKFLLLLGIAILIILILGALPKKPPEPVSKKFANEQPVNIVGYTGNAMEPSISRDGQYLFWNSLNDSVDTKLFYAKKIDAGTFQFVGEVQGVNGTAPHLDAVGSIDLNNNFYWVSTRNFPKEIKNYQRGTFVNGTVTGVRPVEGDFYKTEPGWIIMDAEISPDGKLLFYVNARFTGGPLPAESNIGVAHNVNGVFKKDQNSDALFANINTKDLEYAPSFSASGLEFFFTREQGGNTYIYLASRSNLNEPFGKPELLDITGTVPEAPSITLDGKTLYYHKREGGVYKIFKMTRAE